MTTPNGPGFWADGFEPVAYHDLARRPLQVALQVVEERWCLYANRFWEPGTTILEVTDPSRPVWYGEISRPLRRGSDRRHLGRVGPRLLSRLGFGAAFAGMIGLHNVIPLPDRHLAVVNTGPIAELSREPYNPAGIIDLTDETAPRLISLLPPAVPHVSAACATPDDDIVGRDGSCSRVAVGP